jgi:hypothetical protein
MESIRNRARDNLPPVLLTLLSIVQAIALETLWDHIIHRQELFEASWTATLGWLQVSVSLLLIILIWLVYVSLVMRFRWTPTIADLTLPFFVGLVELLMIEVMGLEKLGAWFLVLALISAMLYWLTHSLFIRTRRDPENAEFFRHIRPATWRDHVLNAVSILVAILTGVWLWLSGDKGWVALLALLIALFLVGYQIRILADFWRTSMGET